MSDVVRNVAPETTEGELDAAYAVAARESPLYPYEPRLNGYTAWQRDGR
jgi:hypothetical protein